MSVFVQIVDERDASACDHPLSACGAGRRASCVKDRQTHEGSVILWDLFLIGGSIIWLTACKKCGGSMPVLIFHLN